MTRANAEAHEQSPSDWPELHERLVKLAAQHAGLDAEEGTALLSALRQSVHTMLGFGSFQEYVERLFGYGPRFVAERLRVAQALETLPVLACALRSGAISWSAVRELSRVATPETETAWLLAGSKKTLRELERLVSGLTPGALPGDPQKPAARRHILRLEVSAETFATYREAIGKLQRDSGGESQNEDALLLLMSRQVLMGPADSGRAGYQLTMTLCESCGAGHQHGRGQVVPVGPEVIEMAACDAQRVPRDVPETSAHTHVGGTGQRATQTIPPATRRAVMQRDGGRCQVDGCRHATFVDVHHLVPRADGGTHDRDFLLCLCGSHHRAVHRGTLIIEGRVSTGLRFLHADGAPYGGSLVPRAAEAQADAFLALQKLGFSQSEAHRALHEVRSLPGGTELSTGEVVRAALKRLYPSSKARPSGADTVREQEGRYRVRPTWVQARPGRGVIAARKSSG